MGERLKAAAASVVLVWVVLHFPFDPYNLRSIISFQRLDGDAPFYIALFACRLLSPGFSELRASLCLLVGVAMGAFLSLGTVIVPGFLQYYGSARAFLPSDFFVLDSWAIYRWASPVLIIARDSFATGASFWIQSKWKDWKIRQFSE